MNILVEFAGMSRIIAKEKQITLSLESGTTCRQVVQKLGNLYPDLVGQVISPDGCNLYASNMLNRNGKHMIRPEQMDDVVHEGDRLILMSVLAGG